MWWLCKETGFWSGPHKATNIACRRSLSYRNTLIPLSVRSLSSMSSVAHLSDSCLFCGIVQGKIPCFKVYETEHSHAFLDINPVSEGHALVIPKYHAVTLLDLPDEYLSDIGPILKKLARAAGADNFNVLQNNGKLAFQHVDHVHFHVVPKTTPTDGLVLNIDDNWPTRQGDKEALAALAEKLKQKL
ncbi:hypothetical protein HGRIS_003706 [Hohenbuehelia grisea]|uniref:HIT domain-containing protein n=1 Tax=Hohenbuehelia grisea TaxID=104357 RepID=A0ABR3JGA4_9AGAR